MSINQQIDYGVRRFDLSEARTNRRIPVKAQHLSILESGDTAEIRLGDPNSSAIPTRNVESLTIPDGVENIYLSNDAGTGELVLLLGIAGVSSSVGSPEIEGTIDISDREAREIGKIRTQNSDGVLINPATDETLSSQLTREIAGVVSVQENTPLDVSAATVPVSGDLTVSAPDILTDQTTTDGATNAAVVQLGKERDAFDVHYELTAESPVTVEVSKNGTDWRAFREVTGTGPATLTEDTAYEHVRAYSTNVTIIEISAKGV